MTSARVSTMVAHSAPGRRGAIASAGSAVVHEREQHRSSEQRRAKSAAKPISRAPSSRAMITRRRASQSQSESNARA